MRPRELPDSIEDHLPPHSIEAEQGVLGCVLLSPEDSWEVAATKIAAKEAFYDLRHQTLWSTFVALAEASTPIDMITVTERLKIRNELEAIGGIAYISGLHDAVPSAANLKYYLDILHEKWVRRRIQKAAAEVQASIHQTENAAELVSRLAAAASALSEDASPKADCDVQSAMKAALLMVEQHKQGRKKMLGLSTGLNFLDNMTSGLQPHQYWVLAARPGGYKTALAMQIADFVATELREPVGVFSQEMDATTLALRMLTSRARVNFQAFRNGFLDVGAAERLTVTSGAWGSDRARGLGPAVMRIDETPGLYCEDLELKVHRMYREFGCKLFVLDYLQLMQGKRSARYRGDNLVMQMADASATILRLKKELPICFLVLAQENTNREKAEKDRKPVLSDLKDSQKPAQDADVVAFLYEPDMKAALRNLSSKDEDKREIAKAQLSWLESAPVQALPPEMRGDDWPEHLKRINLYVAKQRNGPTGDCRLVVVKPWMRLIDAYVGEEDGTRRAGAATQKGFGGSW